MITHLIRTYVDLFIEFFNIGFFSFGGGYATLPFLYDLVEKYNWYSANELSNAVALSAITPGPIGINVATYAGLKVEGIKTALFATFAEVLPAFFIVIISYKFLKRYKDSKLIKNILFSLRPISCALLSYVCIKLFYQNLLTESSFRLTAVIIFLVLFLMTFTKRVGVVLYMLSAVLIGYVLNYIFTLI